MFPAALTNGHISLVKMDNDWLVVDLPLWKIWKSIGMMNFPICGKKNMFPNHQPDDVASCLRMTPCPLHVLCMRDATSLRIASLDRNLRTINYSLWGWTSKHFKHLQTNDLPQDWGVTLEPYQLASLSHHMFKPHLSHRDYNWQTASNLHRGVLHHEVPSLCDGIDASLGRCFWKQPWYARIVWIESSEEVVVVVYAYRSDFGNHSMSCLTCV